MVTLKRISSLAFLCAALACAQNTAKFPGAVPSAADLGVAANRAETTLASGINATATSIPVASSSGFKAGSFATIDNEIIAICSIPDGNHLNAGVSSCPNVDGRGTDTANGGGASASHLANAKVQARIVAWNVNQGAAELVAIASKLHKELISVRDFHALGDGVNDDTAEIQAAMDSCPYDEANASPEGGCLIYVPVGRYLLSNPGLKVKRPGIVMVGACMWTGPGEEPGSCSTFKAAAGMTSPLFTVDPADSIIASAIYVRGIGLNSITFDVTAAPTIAKVINLLSVSNLPTWSNVTVWGNAGTALYVGKSAKVGAQISEGLVFENFYMYALYAASGTYAGSHSSPGVELRNVNEIEFHSGKLIYAKDDNVDEPAVLVSTDGASFGGYHTTFRGVSTLNTRTHYRVSGSGVYVPLWVRWYGCTFEGYNRAIAIHDLVAPADYTKNIYIDQGNRFFGGDHGASPKRIVVDWVIDGAIHHDSYFDAAGITLGANTKSLFVWGPLANVTNSGSNSVCESSFGLNALHCSSSFQTTNAGNAYYQANKGAVSALLRADTSSGFFGTTTAHSAKFGGNNLPVFEGTSAGLALVGGGGVQGTEPVQLVGPTLLQSGSAGNAKLGIWDQSGVALGKGGLLSLDGNQTGNTRIALATIQGYLTDGTAGASNADIVLQNRSAGAMANALVIKDKGFLSLPKSITRTNLFLVTPVNGYAIYCSDCTVSTCAGGGAGAWAFGAHGAWVCPF